jgi:cytochrome c553
MHLPFFALVLALLWLGCKSSVESSPPPGDDIGPPTPLREDQVLADHEAEARRGHDRLEHDLSATLRQVDRLLERAPWLDGELAALESEAAALGVPLVTRVADIVADDTALVALGKSFFWDQLAGSDGQTACASCHHSGGADGRWAPRGRNPRVSRGVARRAFSRGSRPQSEDVDPSVTSASAGYDYLCKLSAEDPRAQRLPPIRPGNPCFQIRAKRRSLVEALVVKTRETRPLARTPARIAPR